MHQRNGITSFFKLYLKISSFNRRKYILCDEAWQRADITTMALNVRRQH